MTTASEIQARMSTQAREDVRARRVEESRQRTRWAVSDVRSLAGLEALPIGFEISGDHRPRPAREWMRPLSAVERLVGQWNATPDYAPTDYDRGRVDQRHAMTEQLLEALEADDGDDE